MSNAAPEAALEPNNAAATLASVLAVLRKRGWMILVIMLAVPAFTGFIVNKQPRMYEATATVVIESSVPQYMGQNFKDVVELEASWWSAHEQLQTELRVMKSHSHAVAVAKALCDKHLGPAHDIAFTRMFPALHCDSREDLAKAAPTLQALLQVDPVKESRAVNMTVAWNEPELAAMVANTMAQVFIERNLERRLSQSEGAATWLGDELGDLTLQLNEAEHALIEFKKKNNVVAVAIDEQQNDLSNRRKKLGEELNTVLVKLIALRAQRDQYHALASDDPLNMLTPVNGDNSVLVKLKELYVDQYAKLVELRGKYLEKHPTVLAQEARIAALKNDLTREAGLLGRQADVQYQTLQKQERDLRAAVDTATREALQLEQRAIEYNRLKRTFDRLSKLSDQVGGREREQSLAQHLRTNNVRLLDAALIPKGAVSPNVPRSVGVALVVALLLALALAFLLEVLDSTVKTQDDIEKTAKLVFLGLIPRIDNNKDKQHSTAATPPPAVADLIRSGSTDLHVLAYPRSPAAECCRAIRTNLLFMTPDKTPKSLLITSAGPMEGKTTTAVSLAITMAQSGLRVLLVDTDMRRPRLHKAFGIPATPDGVSRLIVGELSSLSVVRETGIPNLSLLPCGALPPNPAELLHAERFKQLVKELTDAFDRVIFDSPPVGAVTDASILSRLTDGTILVAKSHRTSKGSLSLARRLLSEGGVNVLGCVLNDLDLSKAGQYGYYYYSRYGYYGGYGGTAPPDGAARAEQSD